MVENTYQRRSRRWWPSLVLAAVLAGGVWTQVAADPRQDASDVAVALDGIRSELGGIATLLATVESHQQVNALIARLKLKQERVGAIEGRLESARNEEQQIRQDVDSMRSMVDTFAEDELDGTLQDDQRRQLEFMRREMVRSDERAEGLRLKILELENDLTGAERDIRALEELVDEQLGLR